MLNVDITPLWGDTLLWGDIPQRGDPHQWDDTPLWSDIPGELLFPGEVTSWRISWIFLCEWDVFHPLDSSPWNVCDMC